MVKGQCEDPECAGLTKIIIKNKNPEKMVNIDWEMCIRDRDGWNEVVLTVKNRDELLGRR